MSSTTASNPPSVSAEELHKACVQAFQIGNRARYKFINSLAALKATGLYAKLGSPSIVSYAKEHFGYERATTFECLRVAEALKGLKRLAAAFHAGEICWSALREITRVSTKETQEEWLKCARESDFDWLKAEVQDALEKKRTHPRKKGSSMPKLKVRLTFEFTAHEHDLVAKALRKGAVELGEKLGGQYVTPKDVFLFLSMRMLKTDPEGTPRGRVEREASLFSILYHVCPECRGARLPTTSGPVDVPGEVVECIEGDAERVTIRPDEEKPRCEPGCDADCDADCGDELPPPNTPPLRRKILLRDGLVCANPHCRHRLGLHAHHVKLRSRYGPTALYNEIAVCPICHSLIHLGLLRVEGDPLEGLKWTTRANELNGDSVFATGDTDRLLEDIKEIPVYRAESTTVDSPDPSTDPAKIDYAALYRQGCERLGIPIPAKKPPQRPEVF